MITYYSQWIFGLFLTVILIYLLLREVWRDLQREIISPYTGLSIGYLFFMVGPLIVLHVQGYYDKPVLKKLTEIPDLTIDTAFWGTIYVVTCGLVIAWLHRYYGRKYKQFIAPKNDENYFKYLTISFSIYFLFVIYDVMSTGLLAGDGHWYYSRQESMEGSQLSVLLVYVKHSLRWLVLALLLHGFDRGYLKEIVFYSLLLAFLTMSVYFSGNRFGIALAGIGLVLIYLKKKRYSRVILMSVLGFPIAWFGTMFMWVRGIMYEHGGGIQGMIDLMFDLEADADTGIMTLLMNVFEGVNFNVMNAVLNDFPERVEFLYGATFIKPLVFWIPRSLWADKPDRLSQILGMEYAGDEHLALVSTYPGELWANFGYLSWLAMLPLTLIFIRFLKLIFGRFEFGWCLAFFYMFTMSRASYGGTFIELFLLALLMLLLNAVIRKKYVWGTK